MIGSTPEEDTYRRHMLIVFPLYRGMASECSSEAAGAAQVQHVFVEA
jgi:hypothetical protein